MIRNVLKTLGFFRIAIVVGVGIPFVASSAFAQAPDSTPDPAAPPSTTGADATTTTTTTETAQQGEAARVIVTGSNIPTAEEVGPNPVLTVSRDLIEKSGERTAEELIKDLPVANANGVPISNNATGFTPGASAVSLRGFGPDATLVLIDGRRVAPYPIGAGGTSAFIDLSSIPAAAIQSIEVLKDGASTTYGADAVAGVVNIKFRKTYKGAEAYVEYGNTLDKDSSRLSTHVLFGIGDDKTNVNGVINFEHRNSIFNRDRGFSNFPPFLSSNSSPLNLRVTNAAINEAFVNQGFAPIRPANTTTVVASAPPFTDGFAPVSDYRIAGGNISFFNFNKFSSSFPEIERYGGFVNFDHKWFGDTVVIYGDMFYNKTKIHNELAPAATGNFNTPGSTILSIPPREEGPTPFGGPTRESVGQPEDSFNPFNPFQQVISGASRARFAEFGNRIFDATTDAYMATLGVRGDKLFNGTWGYDGAIRYSEIQQISQGRLQSAERFNRAVNANDPIFDPDSDQFIGTTIPYNPFGDYRVDIPTNAATVDFVNVNPKDVNNSKLFTADFLVYTTELFKLPAGGVGFAAGAQFRRETLKQDPDQLNLDGDIVGSSPNAITEAGRKTYAFFGETSIPIFAPDNNVRMFRSLDITMAIRAEFFKNNDTNVVVPKFGMRWQPLDESLTLRVTWGKGYRQPSLFELFSSPTAALSGAIDPQTGVFNPETPITFTGNPTLTPEDSHAFSAGFVFTPKFVPGLTLSMDIWDIERSGVVITPTLAAVLQREAQGTLQPGESVERDPDDGTIQRINFSFQNAGSQKARGIDMGAQYQIETGIGTFTSYTSATYLDSFEFANIAGQREQEVSNETTDIFASNEGFLKWRGRQRLDWSWNNIQIGITERYTAGFHENSPFFREGGAFDHWVKHTWMTDVQGSYEFSFVAPVESAPVAGYSKDGKQTLGSDGKTTESAESQTANYSLPIWQRVLDKTTITVGCNNVFGQDPPDSYGGGGNSTKYPGFLYDITGRFVYVSLKKKF